MQRLSDLALAGLAHVLQTNTNSFSFWRAVKVVVVDHNNFYSLNTAATIYHLHIIIVVPFFGLWLNDFNQ